MAYWRSDRYEMRHLAESAFSEARLLADWNAATRLRVTKADIAGLKHSTIDDAAVVLRAYERRGVIRTVQSESRFSFGAYLTGKGIGAAPVLRPLMEAAMGGRSSATATTVSGAASTTTVIDVASAAGIVVGDIVRIGIAGDGRGGGECRVVTAVDTVPVPDQITLGMAVANAPANADAIGTGDTFFIDGGNLSDISDAQHAMLALLFLGAGEDRYQMRGCSLGFKLVDLGPQKVPTVEFEALVNAWELVGSPAAVAELASDGEIVVKGCNVFVQDVGTTTRNAVHVADIAVESGQSWVGQPSPAGSEGIVGWRCQEFNPSMTIRPYYDADWMTWFTTPTRKHILIQLGSAANSQVALFCPNAEIEATPGRADAAGVATSEVTFRCREAASGSGDLALSSLKIALL